MAKKKLNPANAAAIAHIFENYEIKSVLDIQEAFKDMFGGAMEQMLEGELDAQLGYDRNENAPQTANRRNGTSSKTVRNQLGKLEIDISRATQGFL